MLCPILAAANVGCVLATRPIFDSFHITAGCVLLPEGVSLGRRLYTVRFQGGCHTEKNSLWHGGRNYHSLLILRGG
jgi:hypothetical protein